MLLASLASLIWSPPTFLFLLVVSAYFTYNLNYIQFCGLVHGFRLAFRPHGNEVGEGSISPFQALMTSLSSTIGTGNIVGVAGAIMLGGPGAVFWLWVSSLLLMTVKYAEGMLGVKYRRSARGGPMYYLRDGCKRPYLASAYAVSCVLASFGIGNMVQANAIGSAVFNLFSITPPATGIVLVPLCGMIVFGGIRRIGAWAGFLTPFMALSYFFGCAWYLFCNFYQLGDAILLILHSAFSDTPAVAGGFAGATVAAAVRSGISRGVFANEAGLGNAAIAAAAAKTTSPTEQGLITMTGAFLSTFIVCTVTALVLVVSGSYLTVSAGQNGAALIANALSSSMMAGAGTWFVNGGLILFALTSIIGWSYYGECCCSYLHFPISLYRVLYIAVIPLGTIIQSASVWYLADFLNGCMVWLNVLGILFLRREVVAETLNS